MKKTCLHFEEPHARYEHEENGFICLICERAGFKKWVYEPWEIPKHLKKDHKINRKDQVISGWNEEFEKAYLKNRGKLLKYKYDDEHRGIFVYDIEFERKKYRKEQFLCYPSEEPEKRMKYCSAFYNLWIQEKKKKTSHSLYEKFMKYFNRLCTERRKKKKAINWDDFKNLSL